ncbi:M15 family metallopeptidase [Thalassiella azotivora]
MSGRQQAARAALAGAAVLALLAGCGSPDAVPDAADQTAAVDAPDDDGALVSVPPAPEPTGPPTAVLRAEPPPSPTVLPGVAQGTAPSGAPDGFVWSVAQVGPADLPHSWREGCPVPPSDLRAVTLSHRTMDGGVRTGVLVVHADLVERTRRAFARLFEIGFPITSIRPVDEFGGDDDASMAADNTSGFNCRAAVSDGPTSWSKHAYGRAIDVNPVINPYVLGGRVLPPKGARYTDRDPVPGMFTPGSEALAAFTDNGFTWGGTWRNPDYQHLQR